MHLAINGKFLDVLKFRIWDSGMNSFVFSVLFQLPELGSHAFFQTFLEGFFEKPREKAVKTLFYLDPGLVVLFAKPPVVYGGSTQGLAGPSKGAIGGVCMNLRKKAQAACFPPELGTFTQFTH